MSTTITNNLSYPELREPPVPALSIWGRFISRFSSVGRIRLALWHTGQTPDDTSCEQRAAAVLNQEAANDNKRTPDVRLALTHGYTYLAYRALTREDAVQATSRIAELRQECPDAAEVVPLQWMLMELLWGQNKSDEYASQAREFLANPMLDNVAHGVAALKAISRVYLKCSSAVCADILSTANAKLASTRQIEAAKALSHCPKRLASKAEASEWAKRADFQSLTFSKVMYADALTVSARAAEWRQLWSVMEQYMVSAYAAVPGRPLALYWLTRARLQARSERPDRDLEGKSLPNEPEWERLRILLDLYKDPSIERLRDIEPILADRDGLLEQPEKVLVLRVVERVLATKHPATIEEIDLCGRIAEHALALSKPPTWAQVAIARKEIRIDRKYEAAYRRLDTADPRDNPDVLPLSRLARLLAGEPCLASSDSGRDPVSVAEYAASYLAGPAQAADSKISSKIRLRLRECRQDPLCRELPALGAVLDALCCAVDICSGTENGTSALNCRLPKEAPRWAIWLHARAVLLALTDSTSVSQALPMLDAKEPTVAWAIELWAINYPSLSHAAGGVPSQASTTSDAYVARLDRRLHDSMTWLRNTRATHYRKVTSIEQRRRDFTGAFGDLGNWVQELCVADLRFEAELAAARHNLAANNPVGAVTRFEALNKPLEKLQPILSAFWRPVVRYWLGVAHATLGKKESGPALESLMRGPLDLDARAQLGLLQIRDGHLAKAASYIDAKPSPLPAMRYAQALLHERQGDAAGARALLQPDAISDVFGGSQYELPVHRLLAAIAERTGNPDESERLNEAILRNHPDDEITLVRLGRTHLRKAYEKSRSNGHEPIDSPSLDRVMASTKNQTAWWRRCKFLYALMHSEDAQVHGATDRVREIATNPADVFAWTQYIAYRLHVAGRLNEVWGLYNADHLPEGPAWFESARLTFRAWRLITKLGQTAVPENASGAKKHRSNAQEFNESVREISSCAATMKSLANDVADANFQHWTRLAQKAHALATSTDESIARGIWQDLAPLRIGYIPGIWSPDRAVAREAAESLNPSDSNGNLGWNEAQQLLVDALTAVVLGNDDSYLEAFGYLEPALESLPVSGALMWLKAARIRFSRKDWKGLLDGDLPDCVASLSDVNVRLLMAFAYARSAVDDFTRGDERSALAKVRQARDNLSPLVESH